MTRTEHVYGATAHARCDVLCRHPSSNKEKLRPSLAHPVTSFVLPDASTIIIGTVGSTWLKVWWKVGIIICIMKLGNLAVES